MLLTNIFEQTWFFVVLWIAVLVLAVVIELATEELISIWFGGGAIIGIILAIVNVPWYVQVLVVVITSAILIIISQVILAKKRKNEVVYKSNIDAVIGEKIHITKKVTPNENGEGKYHGVIWVVKSDEEIEEGVYATIVRVEGNKFVVTK